MLLMWFIEIRGFYNFSDQWNLVGEFSDDTGHIHFMMEMDILEIKRNIHP